MFLRVPALKFLDSANTDVPWQRVVSSAGKISSRGPGTDGAQRQREALEEEGVEVQVGQSGSLSVNFSQVGWFPEHITVENRANQSDLQPTEDEQRTIDHRGNSAMGDRSIDVPDVDDLDDKQ